MVDLKCLQQAIAFTLICVGLLHTWELWVNNLGLPHIRLYSPPC